ncbi:glycine cleavage system H protein, mitochondrial-like [Macrosteles quadrilineatus]|uniref:glycine cleavage system H protein, mitochondrial-like n=1 Tax=Macrosteles quadrilineatus TaxID=74068 RepID=UPI0023E17BB0|nr:glycine cleavage system H protein, mitochondrial-like [Macrosteles quadrilineatus]XP_054290325.1 glycine cleavage system H protein, mitochondrial-like [Macrosteles quadrilineatus]
MVCLRLCCVLSNSLTKGSLNCIPSSVNKNKLSHPTVYSVRSFFRTVLNYSTQPDCLYTPKHEWIKVNGEVGTVGISHYAQDSLGDVVFAQLPEVGEKIEKDSEVGALESVKAASELYSPVSGTVVEKNTEVEDTPALINQSCYDKGWLFKVQLSKPDELKDLLNEEKYKEFLKTDQESKDH